MANIKNRFDESSIGTVGPLLTSVSVDVNAELSSRAPPEEVLMNGYFWSLLLEVNESILYIYIWDIIYI